MTAAERLVESAASRCFAVDPPTTDGVGVLGVSIDFGVQIFVDFQLWFFADFEGREGHSAAPARFTVSRTKRQEDRFTASFGCGLRDAEGSFWYPRRDRQYGRTDRAPDLPEGWAFWREKSYGEATLSRWLRERDR